VGTWEVVSDGDNNVLAQKASNDDDTFNVVFVDGTHFKDVDLRVRLKAVAGKLDQAGGVVWRARDKSNYYILEIGCGTGQLTRDLAPTGCDIVCVEPCAAMADVARRNLCRYLALLETFSGHRLLPEDQSMRLFTEIGRLIDVEYDGSINHPYLTTLCMARKQ
jgi:SAM-dependent methyltransferase